MQLVIDETSWRFDMLAPDDAVEALESMLDLLDIAFEQGHSACYYADLFTTPVYHHMCFYELYDPDAPVHISREIQERIAGIFFGLQKWDEVSDNFPTSFEVEVDGGPKEIATSIAWAHQQTLLKPPRHIACLVLPAIRQPGCLDVVVDSKKTPLWFVGNDQNYLDYFRWLIIKTTKNPAGMELFSHSAFPELDYSDNAFNSIKDMSKPYGELVETLVHHLAVLSDHGKRIFLEPWDKAPAELGALGVNATDENGGTKADSDARKERTAKVQGVDTLFWWHTKLQAYVDRIHFNPDAVAKGGRIIVGKFCSHFKT